MTMVDDPPRERFSLKRWSQRKHAAAREPAPPVVAPAVAAPADPATAKGAPAVIEPAPVPALPPVDSLTFDADFTAFMKPDIDPSLKRAALKKLFTDPRFNVMDGLDTYIDDYSIPSPLDPEVARQLVQARYIFDPPKTQVNERGEVEDVPDEVPEPAAPADEAPPALAEVPAPTQVPVDVPVASAEPAEAEQPAEPAEPAEPER
jgi:hypothetical protein